MLHGTKLISRNQIPQANSDSVRLRPLYTCTMVLHNPNNWHWVNKDVSEWAREYLEANLTTIEAEKGEVSAKIAKITSMDGDVDVSQRKGKVITLFDVKLQLDYEGKLRISQNLTFSDATDLGSTEDDSDVTGSITIPEVAHDTEEDEYVVCSLLSLSRPLLNFL